MKNMFVNKKPKLTEHQIQVQCVSWFKIQYPKHIIFAIPNGIFFNSKGGGKFAYINKLKASGLLPGVPDLFIAVNNKLSAGLFIEMKRGKGKLYEASEVQKELGYKLMGAGYTVKLGVSSLEEFQGIVNDYLKS